VQLQAFQLSVAGRHAGSRDWTICYTCIVMNCYTRECNKFCENN
jgi:hypothetical protein